MSSSRATPLKHASSTSESGASDSLSPKHSDVEAETLSARAVAFAGEIERGFAQDENALSGEAIQSLMGALCRIYAVQAENGADFRPIKEGQSVSPTAVMVTASGLLEAANLAVFELGMWKSWTGR